MRRDRTHGADDSRAGLCDNAAMDSAPMVTVRKFNTEGPVVAADHYHIPPLERIDLDAVLGLIWDKKYFVLHAPRQTGKTSALLALRDLLNGGGQGDFRCVYANVEGGTAWVLGGSAFNIKARSLRLGDFSEREVRALLAQHTGGHRAGVHGGGGAADPDADRRAAVAGERAVPRGVLRRRDGA